MTRTELYRLIDLYFDGETSIAQERTLRSEVALPKWSGDPRADEVRAVMGFALVAPHRPTTTVTADHGIPGWWRVAAAVAVIAIAAGGIMLRPRPAGGSGECYAYVDGKMVDDLTTVHALLEEELSEIKEASEDTGKGMAEEWNAMREAFDEINM